MTDDSIHQLFPYNGTVAAFGDDDLLGLYAPVDRSRPVVRANFISSIDGSASAAGLSGGLGAPADKRVFDLLRRLSDVVLVGAGTVRAEGYGAMRLDADAAAWRVANGLAAHPTIAIVSGSLQLDAASSIFTEAPVRPLILTVDTVTSDGDGRRRSRLSELSAVADVIVCGDTTVDASRLVGALAARGLVQVHSEGGPRLLGALIEADLLDELCLTTSPVLEGGEGPRISRAAGPVGLRAMRLDHILLSGSMVVSKYSRDRHGV